MEGRGHLWEGEGCTCGRGKGALVGGGRVHLWEGEGCTCGRGKGALVGGGRVHLWEGDTETWALEGGGWGHLQVGAMVGRGH